MRFCRVFFECADCIMLCLVVCGAIEHHEADLISGKLGADFVRPAVHDFEAAIQERNDRLSLVLYPVIESILIDELHHFL